MKHATPSRRLTAMQPSKDLHRASRPIAMIALRTALTVALALLLILVLLPAVIAAQAASI